MQKPFDNKHPPRILRMQRVLRSVKRALKLAPAGAMAVLTTGLDAYSAPMPAATFDTVFSAKGEPSGLHYQVIFAGPKGSHTLEVWRDGETRLRRKTDDTMDSYVVRDPSDPVEYQMTVVDYGRRITTQIDRTNLIRLGHFSEWFDLGHGLRHPVGAYQLQPSKAPNAIPAPIAACKWYELRQNDGNPHRICWSTQDRLPMMIWSEKSGLVWRVTAVAAGPIPGDVFALNDAGFVRNNANADISDD